MVGFDLGLRVRYRPIPFVGIRIAPAPAAAAAAAHPPHPPPLIVVVSSSFRKGNRQSKWQRCFICHEFLNNRAGCIINQQPQPQPQPQAKILAQSAAAADGDGGGDEDEQRIRKPQCLLVERYKDGTAKRYKLDTNSQLQAICEEHDTSINILQKEHFSDLSWLPHVVREFILPTGFPGSVSDDYLEYMLLQFPTNVTGWVCHALVTSSLLKAVGVGSFTSTSAAASAAATRWVSKDGLGAIGRLLIGGRFGNLFDDDPKKWRMYADFIGSTGSIFELSTQMYPAYFLPLASLGNLAKAVARGLKDPSFRVIQNHFAIAGNLGEVAAKEEVWEVTAQLLGLAVGILIMDTPGIQTSYANLTFTWFTIRMLHLWLRYQSLSVLRFHTINLKRAQVLVKSHVLHHTVPGYVDCNKEENILSWERFLQPRITFGVSMEKMVGREGSSNMVKALLEIYTKQKYILFVNHEGSGGADYRVTFKVGATSLSVLKSLWHVHWLHEHPTQGADDDVLSWLEDSLPKLDQGFAEFLQGLEIAGWDKCQIILKVPQDILFHETESQDPDIIDE